MKLDLRNKNIIQQIHPNECADKHDKHASQIVVMGEMVEEDKLFKCIHVVPIPLPSYIVNNEKRYCFTIGTRIFYKKAKKNIYITHQK